MEVIIFRQRERGARNRVLVRIANDNCLGAALVLQRVSTLDKAALTQRRQRRRLYGPGKRVWQRP